MSFHVIATFQAKFRPQQGGVKCVWSVYTYIYAELNRLSERRNVFLKAYMKTMWYKHKFKKSVNSQMCGKDGFHDLINTSSPLLGIQQQNYS